MKLVWDTFAFKEIRDSLKKRLIFFSEKTQRHWKKDAERWPKHTHVVNTWPVVTQTGNADNSCSFLHLLSVCYTSMYACVWCVFSSQWWRSLSWSSVPCSGLHSSGIWRFWEQAEEHLWGMAWVEWLFWSSGVHEIALRVLCCPLPVVSREFAHLLC